MKPLKKSVTLTEIKASRPLAKIPLVTQSRLSVMPIDGRSFDRILKFGDTSLPRR